MCPAPEKGILLAALGSPETPTLRAVRRYLRRFLMDGFVLDLPLPLRALLVNLLIVPFRAPKTLRSYKTIWTSEGPPLTATVKRLAEKLEKRTGLPVTVGMRYSAPTLRDAVLQLASRNVTEILLVPLYPHYALATYESTVRAARCARDRFSPGTPLLALKPFYSDSAYIEALAGLLAPFLEEPFDHLLFTYHSVPLRHLKKADPTGEHCLRKPDCCNTPSPAHLTCYKVHVLTTTKLLAQRLDLAPEKYSISFQSKFGPGAWLEPATEECFLQLPSKGVRNLVVTAPSFTSDCLETLEQIKLRGREAFLSAGGRRFLYAPCLNDHRLWVEAIAGWIEKGKDSLFAPL